MSNVTNIGNTLQQVIAKTPVTNILKSKYVGGSYFKDVNNIYAYCPYCIARNKRANAIAKQEDKTDVKAGLQTLRLNHFKTVIQVDNQYAKIVFETKMFCNVCKKEITTDDFEKFYVDTVGKEPNIIDLTKVDINSPEFLASF